MKNFITIIILTSMINVAFAADTYLAYHNERFDYSVEYPNQVLYPQGVSINGDGQEFLSKHAGAELIVYGSNNALFKSLAELYSEAARGGAHKNSVKVVINKVLGRNWFEISGYKDGKLFTEKTFLENDQIISVYFEYLENEKSTYNKYTNHIINSLRIH